MCSVVLFSLGKVYFFLDDLRTFLYLYTPTHTHTHTHIYIYVCVYVCVWVGIRYLDEPLRWNYSRLVPDLLSNYRYYFALLSIEHILVCSLVALTVVFSFDQPIAWLLIFFQLLWQGWPFLFFSYIYIFSNIYFSPWQWFFVYFHLQITCRFFLVFFNHKGYYLTSIYLSIWCQPIYMIIIYYWLKRNGSHIEHVL